MAAYRIKFMKRLNTRRERATEPCAWSVNIRFARDFIRAMSAAKRRFERFCRVTNWRLKADYISVDERPLSDEKAQTLVGHWPSFLKSRMDMMQKNLAVGAQRIREFHYGGKWVGRRKNLRTAFTSRSLQQLRLPPSNLSFRRFHRHI